MKFLKNGLQLSDKEIDSMIETTLLGVPARFTINGVFFQDSDMKAFFARGGTVEQMEDQTKDLLRKVRLFADAVDSENSFHDMTTKIALEVSTKVLDYLSEDDLINEPAIGSVQ